MKAYQLSAYHAVRRILPLLMPGSNVVVIGIGGLGHMAVSLLKHLCPARIIAVDRNESPLKLARDLGADLGILSNEETVGAVRETTVGSGVTAVLDFVGAGDTIAMAAQMIAPLRHIVVVGRGSGSFAFKDRSLACGAGISTTFGGSKLELMHLITMAEAGMIRPHITKYPLSRVQEAFDALRAGEISGRAVVIPDGR